MSLENVTKSKLYKKFGFKIAISMLVLFIVVLFSTLFVFQILPKSSTNTGNTITPTPVIVVELPKWWNNNYAENYELQVENASQKTLEKNTYIEYLFDHKALVDRKVSTPDGKDLQVVYYNKTSGEFEQIEFELKNPNALSTTISFLTRSEISKNDKDENYFIYFDGSFSENQKRTTIQKTTVSTDVKITLAENNKRPLTFNISRNWLLKDKTLAENMRLQQVTLKITDEVAKLPEFKSEKPIELEFSNSTKSYKLSKSEINTYSVTIDSADLNTGTYEISPKMTVNNKAVDFKKLSFNVSYPLYVTWSMDWEGFDVEDRFLKDLENLSSTYGVPITHFFNPRIYVAGDISSQRRLFLTNWVKNRMTNNNEEIGLHLHMFKDMVTAAGVKVRETPDWNAATYKTGYSTLTSGYSAEEYDKLIKWGKAEFQKYGLPEPKGTRAGGWFINVQQLKVLADNGFIYDSSGREAYSFGSNPQRGLWNLKTTTKPYQPNLTDQNSKEPPIMNLWEFPNNGIDSTNNTEGVLIQKFKDNFKGIPLSEKQVLTYCTHPHWLDTDRPRLQKLFSEIGMHSGVKDTGPVIYSTIYQAYLAYTN